MAASVRSQGSAGCHFSGEEARFSLIPGDAASFKRQILDAVPTDDLFQPGSAAWCRVRTVVLGVLFPALGPRGVFLSCCITFKSQRNFLPL